MLPYSAQYEYGNQDHQLESQLYQHQRQLQNQNQHHRHQQYPPYPYFHQQTSPTYVSSTVTQSEAHHYEPARLVYNHRQQHYHVTQHQQHITHQQQIQNRLDCSQAIDQNQPNYRHVNELTIHDEQSLAAYNSANIYCSPAIHRPPNSQYNYELQQPLASRRVETSQAAARGPDSPPCYHAHRAEAPSVVPASFFTISVTAASSTTADASFTRQSATSGLGQHQQQQQPHQDQRQNDHEQSYGRQGAGSAIGQFERGQAPDRIPHQDQQQHQREHSALRPCCQPASYLSGALDAGRVSGSVVSDDGAANCIDAASNDRQEADDGFVRVKVYQSASSRGGAAKRTEKAVSSVKGSSVPVARRKNATRETTATLKEWLDQNGQNPYPTKGEKIMLTIVTKMSLTQVSTWFANARRRMKKNSTGHNWAASGNNSRKSDRQSNQPFQVV